MSGVFACYLIFRPLSACRQPEGSSKPALVSQLAAALMDAWERRRDRAAALQVRGSATSSACGPLQWLDRLLTIIVNCI
jgi:hypothetical protein